ncbi:MAG: methylated-DNA--[protein]-cysteine S-methyltransferase [Nitrospiraceae bacterium]|jgi:O-6-methylguanine DNA methyltransferase|nr:methylated-DNA--[protein]-cysteine S-methyltransferase [Nitrospiraceae bacterium]ULA65521.1 MAG: Methylated-DNA--protein-cysteine methyltransferase [Nitrospira sp.]
MNLLSAEIIETPIGNMQAIASARGLCALEFVTPSRQQLLMARLSRWFSTERIEWRSHSVIDDAKRWLQFYFNGRFNELFELMVDLRGTPFELRVWKELRHIKIGRTISYSELATLIGKPKGSRAVGGASRRNPMSLIIPCHRVIGVGGRLTGYGGGVGQKQYLIEHEIPTKRRVSLCHEGIG